ncbi:hypothetical protein FSP39_004516 [Pinctada imbricata]|uniref:F-box domain-containing protein n=1 Tax=Pinctada imbricata TaxID=66713 RepID=A0AA88XW30_PINIB|nr:hypothetical protein FSP39_004516 [Pinctada imbricata]
MESLPDNILLHIFSFTDVKERCVAGRVNRRWRRILRDKSLWRYVNLLHYRLDLQKMWKVIRSHLSDCLISISVKGFVDKGGPSWNKHSLSPAMLQDLRERCPNLKELQMYHCNIDNIECTMLPTSLEKLVFHGCYWPCHWLQNDSNKHLPKLTYIDLSNTKRVDTFDIEDVCKFKNLKVFKANGCYRTIPQSLQQVCQSLTELVELDFGNTGIKDLDLAIHHMTRHLVKLERLNLSGCPGLKASSVCDIISALKKLKVLDVSQCKNVCAEDLLKFPTAFEHLDLLIFDKKQLGDHSLESLKDSLKCRIEV